MVDCLNKHLVETDWNFPILINESNMTTIIPIKSIDVNVDFQLSTAIIDIKYKWLISPPLNKESLSNMIFAMKTNGNLSELTINVGNQYTQFMQTTTPTLLQNMTSLTVKQWSFSYICMQWC